MHLHIMCCSMSPSQIINKHIYIYIYIILYIFRLADIIFHTRLCHTIIKTSSTALLKHIHEDIRADVVAHHVFFFACAVLGMSRTVIIMISMLILLLMMVNGDEVHKNIKHSMYAQRSELHGLYICIYIYIYIYIYAQCKQYVCMIYIVYLV